MDLLKKCLIDFNNQWTNKITEKEVDDDKQLRFTLLDMQKFANEYHNKQLALCNVSCSSDGCYECRSHNLRPKEYNCLDCGHDGYCH